MSVRRRGPSKLTRSLIAVLYGLALVTAAGVAEPPTASADVETAFTIAQVPDTQQEVMRDGNPLLPGRYQWLVDNQAALNLRYVDHTGDVVNWGVADPTQFARADAATTILDNAGIVYGYAIGNHDTAAVAVGGSAATGDVRANLRNTAAFNQAFPLPRYKNVGGTFEAGKADNMYQTFSAGGLDWLVLTHEMWPRQAVLDWAAQVVASHPTYNVIINTHAFIDSTGARPTTGNYGNVNAEIEWQQFISKYSNIKLVLSGHYGPVSGNTGYGYSGATGVNGNKVAQIMTAYHSDVQDQVRLLRIDTATGAISSSVYVPISLNTSYPTGYLTDPASDVVVTGMNWVQPQAQLLLTVPPAPTGVAASAGNGSAAVAFTPPSSGDGAVIASYTVTSAPGGLTATGTGSPVTVTGLANGVSYTFTVHATNSAGNGPESAASNAVTPNYVELLPDPGFESGNGGWVAFKVGTLVPVSSPVRGGARALRVNAIAGTASLVGLTQNGAVPYSVAGKRYTAQCYARATTSGLNAQIRLLQYAQNFSSNTNLGSNLISGLPTNTWTLVRVTGTATTSGLRITPQIYSTNETTRTGSIAYDDCSVYTS